jgi:hypothetical protein
MRFPDPVFRKSRISLEQEGTDFIGPEQVYDFFVRQNGVSGGTAVAHDHDEKNAVARTESRRQPLAMAPRDSSMCLGLVKQEPDGFDIAFMSFVGLRGSRQDPAILIVAEKPEREERCWRSNVSVIEQTGQRWLGKIQSVSLRLKGGLYALRQKSAVPGVVPVPCLPRCPVKP